MIRLVTDSASMLPADLAARFDVDVVPMAVLLDGVVHREGIDLTSAEFYRHLAEGATVTTSAPSPGDLLTAYERAAAAGATSVVSIHTGATYSATVGAATVAAELAPLPVEVVDTGLVSFPVALCVWAAAEAPAGGAAAAALATAAETSSVFVVGVPDLARRGGRFTTVAGELTSASILELGPGGLSELTSVDDVDAALDAMAAHVGARAASTSLRVGVGDADRPELGARLADRLAGTAGIAELVRYDVGPSVGAHTGAGTVGTVWAPVRT